MKIRIDNVEKVVAAIDTVQARAQVRTIVYTDVLTACHAVENRLQIPKKAMNYIMFTADINAQSFPNAYGAIARTRPMSTVITCEYSNGYWYLMDVRRDYCRRPTKAYAVQLTEAAKTAIIERCEFFR